MEKAIPKPNSNMKENACPPPPNDDINLPKKDNIEFNVTISQAKDTIVVTSNI